MSAVLNTNIASLWASKNLQTAQAKMADSVERLSSGLRINRAKDDAAGLAIGNQLTSQINAANQGIRNLNDGISMVQTAESGLSSANEMAQRVLTLATQAANGTLSEASKQLLTSEMQKIIVSINGIAGRTAFGGSSLLNGSVTSTSIQASMSNNTVDISSTAFQNIGSLTSSSASYTETSLAAFAASGTDGTSVRNDRYIQTSPGIFKQVSISDTNNYTAQVGTAQVGTAQVGSVGDSDYAAASSDYAPASSNYVAASNVHAFTLDGEPIAIGGTSIQLYQTSSTVVNGLAKDLSDAIDTTVSSSTGTNYRLVISAAEDYIASIGEQRANLGAVQNQLEYAANQVTDMSGNLSAARSRVMDTDYATETAALTKGQILQQAATAMLAQANQMPNVILSLLK